MVLISFDLKQILCLSIIPRLDEYDIRREAYNQMMERACGEEDVTFLNVDRNFSLNDSRLWSSRDSVHISEDRGIPLLLALIKKELKAMETMHQGENTQDGRQKTKYLISDRIERRFPSPVGE